MGRAHVLPRLTVITIAFAFAFADGFEAQPPLQAPAVTAAPVNNAPTAAAAYDVVTIRPNHQGPGSVRVSINLDLYNATNVSLVDLLRDAYHLRPGQLQDQPKWADEERFDIHAKTLDTSADVLKSLTPEDRERMLRGILADRFHLQVHTETRTLPIFELVPAKGGTSLRPVSATDRNNPFHGVSAGGLSVHNGQLIGHCLPMDRFVDFLAYRVERVVLDKTGLPGSYNLQLNWTPDDQPTTDDSAAPSLFTALEQQLGLKLTPAKAPVSVVVVDHVEPPTDN